MAAADSAGMVECTQEAMVKFYRIRQTCIEMLEDRGYVVTESLKLEGIDEFKAKYTTSQAGQLWVHKENLRLYAEKDAVADQDDDLPSDREERQQNRSIMVFFVAEPKLQGSHISRFWTLLEKEERGCSRAVIVTPTVPTAHCKTSMAACEASGKYFEYFLESELLVNVSKHELVPKHEPLVDKQKRALLADLKIKEGQLPRMLMADPIARHFGLRKGNVVKITRPSETAGQYVTYRLVQA
ncbi:DNA-directed RNA polymerases I [Diplonema papillatum]|nr:DNA-directed RNA polymerases I [Diplonema papillatum]